MKPADIRTQLTPVRSGAVTALPKTLPVPPPVPDALPVAPPPRRVKHASIDIALAGESAYLDSAPPTPNMTLNAGPTQWSVQIGSFAKRANAHKAAAQARRATDGVLAATPARLTMVTRGSIPLWRVRFHNLDETQARSACAALFAKGRPCMAIEEDGRQSG